MVDREIDKVLVGEVVYALSEVIRAFSCKNLKPLPRLSRMKLVKMLLQQVNEGIYERRRT
jgi:hypothetical protein